MAYITFMIGNGFDRACGLESRFIDTFDSYRSAKTEGDSCEAIKRFKNNIWENKEKWSAFEMELADYAPEFKSSEALVACISDYRAHLRRYLKNEQDGFDVRLKDATIEKKVAEEMRRSFRDYYKGVVSDEFGERIQEALGFRIESQYISFNYTNVFDRLLQLVYPGKVVIHVHGTLDGEDEMLGADNRQQLRELHYELDKDAERNIIKPAFANQFRRRQKTNALRAIENSSVICTYGLELGASDRTWNHAIKEWLKKDTSHYLVYYKFALFGERYQDAMARATAEEKTKEELVQRLSDSIGENLDTIDAQIYIPSVSNIFNIDQVIKSAAIQ